MYCDFEENNNNNNNNNNKTSLSISTNSSLIKIKDRLKNYGVNSYESINNGRYQTKILKLQKENENKLVLINDIGCGLNKNEKSKKGIKPVIVSQKKNKIKKSISSESVLTSKISSSLAPTSKRRNSKNKSKSIGNKNNNIFNESGSNSDSNISIDNSSNNYINYCNGSNEECNNNNNKNHNGIYNNNIYKNKNKNKIIDKKRRNRIKSSRNNVKPFSPSNVDNIPNEEEIRSLGEKNKNLSSSFTLNYISPSSNKNIVIHPNSFFDPNCNLLSRKKSDLSFSATTTNTTNSIINKVSIETTSFKFTHSKNYKPPETPKRSLSMIENYSDMKTNYLNLNTKSKTEPSSLTKSPSSMKNRKKKSFSNIFQSISYNNENDSGQLFPKLRLKQFRSQSSLNNENENDSFNNFKMNYLKLNETLNKNNIVFYPMNSDNNTQQYEFEKSNNINIENENDKNIDSKYNSKNSNYINNMKINNNNIKKNNDDDNEIENKNINNNVINDDDNEMQFANDTDNADTDIDTDHIQEYSNCFEEKSGNMNMGLIEASYENNNKKNFFDPYSNLNNDYMINDNNNTSIISSDTGLATSMENFQLLSSDPIGPEDNFWLATPTTVTTSSLSIPTSSSISVLPSTLKKNNYKIFENNINNLNNNTTTSLTTSTQSLSLTSMSTSSTPTPTPTSKESFLFDYSNNFTFFENKFFKDETSKSKNINVKKNQQYSEIQKEKGSSEIEININNCNDVENNKNNKCNNIFDSIDSFFNEITPTSNKINKQKSFENSISMFESSPFNIENDKNMKNYLSNNKQLSAKKIKIKNKGKPGVYIVGGNEEMYLGLGNKITEISHFTFIKELKNIKFISTGENYCMAVEEIKSNENQIQENKTNEKYSNSKIWSFGNNSNGVLGYSDNGYIPKSVKGLENICIEQIVCGTDISVFRSENGSLYACGIYNNSNRKTPTKNIKPVLLKQFDQKIIHVAVGKGYIYGISEDKKFYYWNYNRNQFHERTLDYKDSENSEKAIALNVKYEDKEVKFIKIFSGKYHSFLIDEQKRVWAFGLNQWGQLGIGDDQDYDTPTLVKDLLDIPIEQIACGKFHTLFRSTNGDVYVCGKNDRYQLGIITSTGSIWIPKKIEKIKSCIQIACGSDHSLAIVSKMENSDNDTIMTDRENKNNYQNEVISNRHILYSWGEGENYNLGTGNNISKNEPEMINWKVIQDFGIEKDNRPRSVDMNILQVEAGKGYTLVLME